MSSKTTNFNLHKIDLTDAPPDITVLNGNFDIIDAQLKLAKESVAKHASTHAPNGSDPITPYTIGAVPTDLGDNRRLLVYRGDRTFVNFNLDTNVPYVPTVSNYTFFITLRTTDGVVESVLALPLDSTNRVYVFSNGRGEWEWLPSSGDVSGMLNTYAGVLNASLE